MAELHEIIDKLCKEKGITANKMCTDLTIPRSTMTELRKGRNKTLSLEKAKKIADYFGVSVDDLSGQKESTPTLTAKDERDIEKSLVQTLSALEEGQAGLMFNGEPLDEITRDLLAASLRNSMEMAKKLAKEKYGRKMKED